MSARAAIGRLVTYLVLSGAVTLAIACGGEDLPEQARDLAAFPPPTATASPSATATPTATAARRSLSDTICQWNGNCTPTATATGTRTATATATPVRPSPGMSPTPGAGLTLAQLQRGLIPEDDLEPDWLELDAGVLRREGSQIVVGDYVNAVTDESLWVELYDARSGGPEYRALRLITFQGIAQVTAVAPLEYGRGGVRYRYTFVEDGQRLYGEVAAWQQGPVVVVMQFEGGHAEVCLCDRARRQDARLRAVFR